MILAPDRIVLQRRVRAEVVVVVIVFATAVVFMQRVDAVGMVAYVVRRLRKRFFSHGRSLGVETARLAAASGF